MVSTTPAVHVEGVADQLLAVAGRRAAADAAHGRRTGAVDLLKLPAHHLDGVAVVGAGNTVYSSSRSCGVSSASLVVVEPQSMPR